MITTGPAARASRRATTISSARLAEASTHLGDGMHALAQSLIEPSRQLNRDPVRVLAPMRSLRAAKPRSAQVRN